MIVSWKNAATRRFAQQGKSRFAGLDEEKARRRLQALDQAESLAQIGSLSSIGLHKLKGDRRECWAMTVNGPWRIVFRFLKGNAHDVEIVDYH